MVHGNDLHSLPDGAFKDLTSLQVNPSQVLKAELILGPTVKTELRSLKVN
jgi:hypothetical protein